LREELPELMRIAMDKEARPPELDTFAAAFAVAGEDQEKVEAVALVAEWLQSFKEFPPRQKPASFSLNEVMRELSTPGPGQD
jgi:hypothetical protein